MALVAAIALTSCGLPRDADSAPTCPPVIERAIAVRGGPIVSLRRTTEMRVHFGFPGLWRLQYLFRTPHFYRWTVFTTGEPNHYSWDGSTMRAAVGDVVVGSDDSGTAPLRSHARWHAVTYLDAVCDGSTPASFRTLPLGDGGETTVVVRLRDDGSEYRLTFDRQARLRTARGPIEIPPFGKARLIQHFYDFREGDGLLVAHGTRYEIDGTTLSEELTTEFVANDPRIDDELLGHLSLR